VFVEEAALGAARRKARQMQDVPCSSARHSPSLGCLDRPRPAVVAQFAHAIIHRFSLVEVSAAAES
jgi:hypothetical protein